MLERRAAIWSRLRVASSFSAGGVKHREVLDRGAHNIADRQRER
jgi:hypothetical protein